MKLQILITGADGFLGTNITLKSVERGFDVTAIQYPGTNSKTLNNLNIRKEFCDILDAEKLKELVKGHDVVIHTAANTDVWPARAKHIRDTNIIGTTNVINACTEGQINKLIHIGSGSAFSYGSIDNPGNENSAFIGYKYKLDYIDSKYNAQNLVKSAMVANKVSGSIICPTFMIGPYDSKPSSGQILIALAQGKIPGYTSGGKNFVFVKDVADAALNAIDMGRNGEEYITGNVNLSYIEFFSIACRELNIRPPKFKMPKKIVLAYGFLNSIGAKVFNYYPSISYEMALVGCDNQYLSSEKASVEIAMPKTSIEIAIREAYEWLQKENYL